MYKRQIKSINKAGDAGYVVEVAPPGSFSGTLTIMVGVANDGTVTGVEITKTCLLYTSDVDLYDFSLRPEALGVGGDPVGKAAADDEEQVAR